MKKLKIIIIHDFAGHPFQLELSEKLSNTYHIFHLFSKNDNGPKGSYKIKKNFNVVPLDVGYELPKNNIFKRFFWEINYYFAFSKEIKKIKPDLIINSNVPIIILFLFSITSNIKWIWWVQDIFSEASLKLNLIPKFLRRFVSLIFTFLERFLSHRASHLILISEEFKKFYRNKASTVIENWAKLPFKSHKKNYSKNKFKSIVYAGTIGKKHYSNNFVNIISKFLDNKFSFTLISSSYYAFEIRDKFLNNKNFKYLEFLSDKELTTELYKHDCAFFILEDEASKVSIPSKVYNYLIHELPIFGVLNSSHHTSKLITINDFGCVNDLNDFVLKINDDKWIKKFQNNVKLYNKKINNVDVKLSQFKKIIRESLENG